MKRTVDGGVALVTDHLGQCERNNTGDGHLITGRRNIRIWRACRRVSWCNRDVITAVDKAVLGRDGCSFEVVVRRSIRRGGDHGSIGRVLHAARAHIPIGYFHAEAQDSNQGRKQERHHHCNGAALIITQANQIMQDVYKYRFAALMSHGSDPLLVEGAFAERTAQCWLDLKNDFSDYA